MTPTFADDAYHTGRYSHTSTLPFMDVVEQWTWRFGFDRVYVGDRIQDRVVRLRPDPETELHRS